MDETILSDEFYEQMRTRLEKRLNGRRYEHSLSVSHMAVCLAEAYGVDVKKARLAGLLHDWDKGYDIDTIRMRVVDLKLEVDPYILETMPRLLHGITAAAVLEREYPGMSEDILQSIARHTSAAIEMTDLDMVVYIADVIEPSRPYPAMEPLREAVGKIELEELFLRTYKQVFSYLVAHDYRIHPDTIRVWNYYIARTEMRKDI